LLVGDEGWRKYHSALALARLLISGEKAMGDFLTGAKWGARLLLAGITAGALWFLLAVGHHAVH
jgi:hypothetical protein